MLICSACIILARLRDAFTVRGASRPGRGGSCCARKAIARSHHSGHHRNRNYQLRYGTTRTFYYQLCARAILLSSDPLMIRSRVRYRRRLLWCPLLCAAVGCARKAKATRPSNADFSYCGAPQRPCLEQEKAWKASGMPPQTTTCWSTTRALVSFLFIVLFAHQT